MTYSPGTPGSAGYPSAQGPGSYGAPGQFGPPADPGPSKLPLYLNAAVAALGLIAYLVAFGPMFATDNDLFGSSMSLGSGFLPVVAALLAALLAAVGLLPKASNYRAVVAVLATLALLLAISELFAPKPDSIAIGWAFWVFLVVVLLQMVAAVGGLLLDAGVITAPAPRPKYDQQQYGQYGPPGGYYGAPSQPVPGQRPGYPSQYGGYPQNPAAGGGFGGAQAPQAAPQGPPTPPTGYPSFSPPPAVGPGGPVSSNAPTQQAQTQPPAGGPATP